VYEVDAVDLVARALLRERLPQLVAETCAWAVGLSDSPHHARRSGRVVATGLTLGNRAEADQQLWSEEDAPLQLGETRPGTLGDALGSLMADGRLQAERLDDEVLGPYVLETCVLAASRVRDEQPAEWAELLDELGEDGEDLEEVVRAAEWEAPLRTEAEQLLLAALAHVPLVEVEAEGLPLSLVRAAEAELRSAVAPPGPGPLAEDDVAGAVFLADAALRATGLPTPVPPAHAPDLLKALTAEGLEPEEVLAVLPHLPVLQDTADAVADLVQY
jgi:hypothetical protein